MELVPCHSTHLEPPSFGIVRAFLKREKAELPNRRPSRCHLLLKCQSPPQVLLGSGFRFTVNSVRVLVKFPIVFTIFISPEDAGGVSTKTSFWPRASGRQLWKTCHRMTGDVALECRGQLGRAGNFFFKGSDHPEPGGC